MKKYENKNVASFSYRFAMLHRLQMSLCKKDFLRIGITQSHFPFLVSLVHEDTPVTQHYLSIYLAIDKGTTARAIDQLQKDGYVIRETNRENRRQNLVSATRKAHDVIDDLLITLNNTANVFLQGFTDEEKNTILDLMDRMIINAQAKTNDYSAQA